MSELHCSADGCDFFTVVEPDPKRGINHYLRHDLCPIHYHEWLLEKAQPKLAKAIREHNLNVDSVEAMLAAGAPKPRGDGSSPTWKPGTNVKTREKICTRCGHLIDLRKARNGKVYPAESGQVQPHICSAGRNDYGAPAPDPADDPALLDRKRER